MHRVFVYGTLKRNQPLCEKFKSMDDGVFNCIACGQTVDKYPLVIATQYNMPFLLKAPNADGAKVRLKKIPVLETQIN